MANKHTLEELNNLSRKELITTVLMMQGQLDALNENIEKLIEQVRIANSYRFGRHTETLSPSRDNSRFSMKPRPLMMNLLLSLSRMKLTKGSATNRNHGLLKSIPLRCMLEPMVTIRMNSCVETGQRICSVTVS